MRMKKTWFSYLLWLFYTLITGIMLAVYTVLLSTGKWEFNRYAAAGIIALCFAAAALVCLGGRRLILYLKVKIPLDIHTQNMGECFLAMSLFAAAILYRLRLLLHYTDGAAAVSKYYQMAQVNGSGGVPEMTHGASYVYTLLLSFTLSFTGNKVMAGIVLQAVMQILAMLFLYFAVRFTAGRIPGLSALGFMAFSPLFVGNIYHLEPQGCYLLIFSVGLWFITLYHNRLQKYGYRHKANYFLFILLGMFVGLVTYLDVFGFTLLFFAGIGFMLKKKKTKALIPFGRQFTVLAVSAVTTVGLLILVYALLGDKSFYDVWTVWSGQYEMDLNSFDLSLPLGMQAAEGFAIFFPASFLAIGFWISKEQRADAWMLLFLSLFVIHAAGVKGMDNRLFFIVTGGTMAGLGLRCIGTEEIKEQVDKPPAPVNIPEDIVLEEIVMEPEIKFIENPLPLPKKHVPREMDYGMDVADGQMVYDVNTNENDDFDL